MHFSLARVNEKNIFLVARGKQLPTDFCSFSQKSHVNYIFFSHISWKYVGKHAFIHHSMDAVHTQELRK